MGIEEVKITAGDDARKVAVRFFDNKLAVRGSIQKSIKDEFVSSRELSFQDYLFYLTGISAAEFDGVIQGWYEKLEHDLVRPNTVTLVELLVYGAECIMRKPFQQEKKSVLVLGP